MVQVPLKKPKPTNQENPQEKSIKHLQIQRGIKKDFQTGTILGGQRPPYQGTARV